MERSEAPGRTTLTWAPAQVLELSARHGGARSSQAAQLEEGLHRACAASVPGAVRGYALSTPGSNGNGSAGSSVVAVSKALLVDTLQLVRPPSAA